MSIENTCDDCNRIMCSGDYSYCESCYSKLAKALDKAEAKIDDLEIEIEVLKKQIAETCNAVTAGINRIRAIDHADCTAQLSPATLQA